MIGCQELCNLDLIKMLRILYDVLGLPHAVSVLRESLLIDRSNQIRALFHWSSNIALGGIYSTCHVTYYLIKNEVFKFLRETEIQNWSVSPEGASSLS